MDGFCRLTQRVKMRPNNKEILNSRQGSSTHHNKNVPTERDTNTLSIRQQAD
jgi:hypothetical protein